MFDEYRIHNLFWENSKTFEKEDPHLSLLNSLKFTHPLNWWCNINWDNPGIYILTGGRQIGKSTSTKLLIKHILQNKIFDRKKIFYLPCDEIGDRQQLIRILRLFLEQQNSNNDPFLIIIDEVTFVEEWSRAIKSLADEGWFRKGFCLLTGSDSSLLKDAASSFPGRRGNADIVDFHLSPLSFVEFVRLINSKILTQTQKKIDRLFELFSDYLKTGGYLRAINDLYAHGEIRKATYATFEQWIRGDFIKRNKNTQTLLAILQSLVEVGVSQISYSRLTERVGTISKDTLIEYCNLLERMDVLFTLPAFDQNKKSGAPKKARKFHFYDPFIRNTIKQWVSRELIVEFKEDENIMVEACVASQYYRKHPTFYIKAKGEIDLVILQKKGFVPIEVKWTKQIRPSDLLQLKKYKNSIILTKQHNPAIIEDIKSYPLPLFLINGNI